MDWGFKMNQHESCCWNKMLQKEQFTIVFHPIDDLKLSHKNEEQVNDMIAKLKSVYSIIDSITMHRGKKLHHSLGMTMDFRVQGEVQTTMYNHYIKKMINSLPDDTKGGK